MKLRSSFITKMTVFWVVLCSLVEVCDISEVLAAFIIRAVTHHSDAGGSKHL
jgi:hypothetical protein